MAGSVNKVILVGNVGADPEIRNTQDGREIANINIATTESWKDKNSGERRDKTEWHRVVIFNQGLIGVVKNYVKKGSKLYIEGALQTRKWTDNNNQERYTTEVVLQNFNGVLTMLDSKRDGGAGDNYQESHSSSGAPAFGQTTGAFDSRNNTAAPAAKEFAEELDDEIPF